MDVYQADKAFPSGEGGMPKGMTKEVKTSPALFGGTLPKGEGLRAIKHNLNPSYYPSRFSYGRLQKS